MTIVVDTQMTADRVMKQHPNLSNYQLGKIDRARHTTRCVCGDSKRATGDDAITHALGVEDILIQLGYGKDILTRIIGILHDVFEDCPQKERKRYRRDVRRSFGLRAYMIIEALTRKDGVDYPTQMREIIEKWWWLGLWRIIIGKLADGVFNLATITGFNNYTKEMRQYYKAWRIIREVAIPCRRFVPRRRLASFDEMVSKITTDLPRLRQDTIKRERESDLGYFPTT